LAQGQAAQVQDEALTDTLLDLANYAVLAILALEAPGGNGCKCGGVGAAPARERERVYEGR